MGICGSKPAPPPPPPPPPRNTERDVSALFHSFIHSLIMSRQRILRNLRHRRPFILLHTCLMLGFFKNSFYLYTSNGQTAKATIGYQPPISTADILKHPKAKFADVYKIGKEVSQPAALFVGVCDRYNAMGNHSNRISHRC